MKFAQYLIAHHEILTKLINRKFDVKFAKNLSVFGEIRNYWPG